MMRVNFIIERSRVDSEHDAHEDRDDLKPWDTERSVKSMAGYEEYTQKHGNHFTDALAEWASSKMENAHGEAGHRWSVEDVKGAFDRLGLKKPEKSTWGDAAYAANMAYADYYGISLKSEADCVKQAHADVSDPDGYPGKVFNRWLSDVIGKEIDVPWHDFI